MHKKQGLFYKKIRKNYERWKNPGNRDTKKEKYDSGRLKPSVGGQTTFSLDEILTTMSEI